MGLNDFAERLFAGRWIAGTKIEDAIRESKKLNGSGITTIINHLGEAHHDKRSVEQAVSIYLELIREIKSHDVKADIALKPTEIGLVISKDTFHKNYAKIVGLARKNNVLVWLDMEESEFVDDTIDAYLAQMKRGNVSICIQAYLKRSMNDVRRLLKRGATIRLVKGAYSNQRGSFKTKEETVKNFALIMEYMFKHGSSFTIGSRDPVLVEKALKFNRIYKRDVTYAVLEGIGTGLAHELVMSGEKVAMYVPFGEEWVAYSYRRLKDMRNLKLIVGSLFGG